MTSSGSFSSFYSFCVTTAPSSCFSDLRISLTLSMIS